MTRPASLLLSMILLSGCALDVTLPSPSLDGLPHGLEVALTLEPGEVAPHEDFGARLAITNITADTIRIGTGMGCLVVPGVYRNGVRTPFRGSWWACTAAGASHVFPPGETRTIEWTMRAELYAEHPGDTDGAPAPRGTYTVRAEFATPPDASGRQPAVDATLRVR
jgi:hypothetical protein